MRLGEHGVENLLVILVVEDDHLVLSVVEDSLVIGGFETVIVRRKCGGTA
jgi:hypothetical protein